MTQLSPEISNNCLGAWKKTTAVIKEAFLAAREKNRASYAAADEELIAVDSSANHAEFWSSFKEVASSTPDDVIPKYFDRKRKVKQFLSENDYNQSGSFSTMHEGHRISIAYLDSPAGRWPNDHTRAKQKARDTIGPTLDCEGHANEIGMMCLLDIGDVWQFRKTPASITGIPRKRHDNYGITGSDMYQALFDAALRNSGRVMTEVMEAVDCSHKLRILGETVAHREVFESDPSPDVREWLRSTGQLISLPVRIVHPDGPMPIMRAKRIIPEEFWDRPARLMYDFDEEMRPDDAGLVSYSGYQFGSLHRAIHMLPPKRPANIQAELPLTTPPPKNNVAMNVNTKLVFDDSDPEFVDYDIRDPELLYKTVAAMVDELDYIDHWLQNDIYVMSIWAPDPEYPDANSENRIYQSCSIVGRWHWKDFIADAKKRIDTRIRQKINYPL